MSYKDYCVEYGTECNIAQICQAVYAENPDRPPCAAAQNTKERRKTVRAKRPVQQAKEAIIPAD